MMRCNARDFALLARSFECTKKFTQVRCISSKSSKGEKIKLKMKEDNLFFGKLVETQKQKNKRLKLESMGKQTISEPSTVNSEFAWVLSNSVRLNVVSRQLNNGNESLPKNSEVKSGVGETIVSNSVKDKSMEKVVVDILQKKEEEVSTEKVQSKNCLLPPVIVQQLVNFPIHEVGKTAEDQWNSNSEVMALSAMENKACLKYPSVTKILSATMSDEAKNVLEKWKIKMIQKLGLRGFEIYQAELFEDGKLLHWIISSHLTNKPYDVPNKIKQSFLSLNEVLKDIEQVRAIESHVVHSRLLYRGVVDCIANYRGETCLIDWKKSDSAKDTIGKTYDAPLQLASYIGAVNSDPNYPFQIKKGLIVVAYTDGKPAKVHEVNEDSLKMYWKLWLQRLQHYHTI